MALTPVEVRHVKLARGLLGYRRGTVDRLLDDIAASFEEVWRQRGELTDRVEQLEAEVRRFREQERLLRETLVSAERAAHDTRDAAKREANLILEEAHAEARALQRGALAERDRLESEARRLRTQLRAALETIDAGGEQDAPAEPGAKTGAAQPPEQTSEQAERAPRLDDTMERPAPRFEVA